MTQAILNSNGFATTAGTLTAYAYHPETSEYLGEITPYLSLGTGIPADCTLTAPPVSEAGFVYCFLNGKWVKTENHRGETLYSEKDGSPFEIKQLGPIPEGYTAMKPPAITQAGESIVWTGSAWQLVPPSIEQQALSKYQQGISQCNQMAPQGKTPSDKMQAYYQSLWQIAYPASNKSNAKVNLKAIQTQVQSLPIAPSDLGNPNDPNSGWWV